MDISLRIARAKSQLKERTVELARAEGLPPSILEGIVYDVLCTVKEMTEAERTDDLEKLLKERENDDKSETTN